MYLPIRLSTGSEALAVDVGMDGAKQRTRALEHRLIGRGSAARSEQQRGRDPE